MECQKRSRGSRNDVPKSDRCKLAKCPNADGGSQLCSQCSGPVVWKDEKGVSHGVARSCHACPMNGLNLPVCYAACPGPNTDYQTDGETIVTLGALEDSDGFIQDERLDKSYENDNGESVVAGIDGEDDEPETSDGRLAYDTAVTKSLSPEAEASCRMLLASMFSLDKMDLLIFACNYNGMGFAGAAASISRDILCEHGRPRVKISKQAAQKRMRKAARDNPFIRAFLPSVSEAPDEIVANGATFDRAETHIDENCVQLELFGIDVIAQANAASRAYAENRKKAIVAIRTASSGHRTERRVNALM